MSARSFRTELISAAVGRFDSGAAVSCAAAKNTARETSADRQFKNRKNLPIVSGARYSNGPTWGLRTCRATMGLQIQKRNGAHFGRRQALQGGIHWQRDVCHQQAETQEGEDAPVAVKECEARVAQVGGHAATKNVVGWPGQEANNHNPFRVPAKAKRVDTHLLRVLH